MMTFVFATIERNDELNLPTFTESNVKAIFIITDDWNIYECHFPVQELEGMVNKMLNEKEKDLVIENRFHRQLIGPKGETIQQIRDRYAGPFTINCFVTPLK